MGKGAKTLMVAIANPATLPSISSEPLTDGEIIPHRSAHLVHSGLTAANGTLYLHSFTAQSTHIINNVEMWAGSTAQVGATLIRMAVYKIENNDNGTLVSSTPNDTTLFNVAYGRFRQDLLTSWHKVTGYRYSIGLLIVGATTSPTLTILSDASINNQSILRGASPFYTGQLNTTQSDLPANFLGSNVSSIRAGILAWMGV